MKIVYFGMVIHYGGGPKALVGIARRLSSYHQVEVIDAYGSCKTYLADLRQAGIPVHILVPEARRVSIGSHQNKIVRLLRILAQLPVFLKLIWRLRKTVRTLRPDAVWTNIKTPMLFWAATPGLRGIPFVRSVIECPGIHKLSSLEKRCLKRTPVLWVAVSSETREMLRSLGIPPERIEVVSDTLEPEELLSRSRQPLENELPGMDGFPKVVVPATLLRTKGQHTAISAMARLRDEGYRPTLWLAGDVVGNNSAYRQELLNLVRQHRLESNVHFLGWREDIPAIIPYSDIVAFPSHAEGFGLVVLEAFLLRRPIVSTHVGGIKDQIEPGINGLVFPVDDDRTMAEQMGFLLKNPEQQEQIVARAYQTAIEKFSPRNNTEGYRAVFERAGAMRCRSKRGKTQCR